MCVHVEPWHPTGKILGASSNLDQEESREVLSVFFKML